MAPAYSPITPKVQPILPAALHRLDGEATAAPPETNEATEQYEPSIAPTADYIPQPPPEPFSSDDSTDAIALRAAISALQFQKKKAGDDLRALDRLKQQALDEPEHFKRDLVAGTLHEQRPKFGSAEALLDEDDSDDSERDAALGASETLKVEDGATDTSRVWPGPAEIPDSQPSRPQTASSAKVLPSYPEKPADFSQIPGAQEVVRMPHINWNKYHISGDALDAMHEQQRRWPGHFAYGTDRGREFAVAAPYSPFLDHFDGQQGTDMNGVRKDSVATSTTLATPTATVSEHPMETRRSGKIP